MLIEGPEPAFDRDFTFGKQGEILVDDVLRWIAEGQGRVEVKRSRHGDLKLFVEVEQYPPSRGFWIPSGISVTTADYWAYVKPNDVILLIPTALLTEQVARRQGKQRMVPTNQSANPAQGYLLPAEDLLKSRRK